MKRRPWLRRVWDLLGWGSQAQSRSRQPSWRTRLARAHAIEPLEDRRLMAILYWDPNGSQAGVGGNGTWDLSAQQWNTAADGTGSLQAWESGSEAVFRGTAGSVAIDGSISASALTIETTGYQLQSGSLLASSAGMTINVSTGTSAIDSTIGGSGSIVKTGSGTLTLGGTNTFTGGTTINGGTLVFGASGLGTTGTIAIAGNSTLKWADGNTQDVSGRIAIQANATATLDVGGNTVMCAAAIANDPIAPGSLVKAGAGTLTVTGTDHFSSVTVSAGTLQVGGDNVSTLSYGNITNNGSLVFDSDNNLSIGGVISGSGSVVQQGAGVLTFIATNTYSGGTTVSAGTLMVGAADTSFTLTAQLTVPVAGRAITFIDDTASTIIGTAFTNASGVAGINYVLAGNVGTGAHSIRAVCESSSQTTTTLEIIPESLINWGYRKQITISDAVVDATLTNFPLYVTIGNDAQIGAAALANGYDIRFTMADGTLLSYQRESWSGGGGSVASGTFWVKVPSFNPSTGTTIYIYYGKSDATDGQNATAVWDSNYKGVWHLANGSTLSAADSTNNGLNGTIYGGVTATTGEAGGGALFNGSSGYIDLGTANPMTNGAITIDAWVNPSIGTVMIMKGNDVSRDSYGLESLSGKVALFTFAVDGSKDWLISGDNTVPLNVWTHVVGVIDGHNKSLYINGVLNVSNTFTGTISSSTQSFWIGAQNRTNYNYWYSGVLDDVRVSNAVRSAEWIRFEYDNIASSTNVLTWSSEQTVRGLLSVSALSASTSSAPASTTITLTAQLSFGCSGQTVTFRDDTASTTLGTAVTNAGGVATLTYTIPAGAALGDHTFRATCGSSSQTTTVNVTAGISAWAYRKQITISDATVNATLTDFPVYVTISNDAQIGAAALANGYDIRFTMADGTLLSYQRESWSGGGGSAASGTFWVKVPSFNPSTGATIYIYYGKFDATDGQNATAVWDSNYKGVWHLPNGSTLSAADSTSNGLNGTINGGVTATTGEAGGGASFNGTTGDIGMATANPMASQVITMEVWVKCTKSGVVLMKGTDASANSYGIETDGTKVHLFTFATNGAPNWLTSSSGVLSSDTWTHIVGVINGQSKKLYINGDLNVEGSFTGTIASSTQSLWMGAQNRTGYNYWYGGALDDVRVSSVVRSPAWIKFEYDNIASSTNVLAWSGEQTVQGVKVSALTASGLLAGQGTALTLTAQVSIGGAGQTVTFVDDTTSTTIGTATTNASGIATLFYTVPTNATLGSHTLRAACGSSSQTIAVNVAAVSVNSLTINTPSTLTGTLGSGSVTNNASLVFDRSGSVTVANVIQGTGSLVQDGNGVLTLTGANTYSGGTTINRGTLQLGSGTALGATAGSLTLTGGTVDLNSYNLTVGSLSGTAGTITDNSTSTGVSTLTISQAADTTYGGEVRNGGTRTLALTKSGSGTLTLSGTGTFTSGVTVSGGTLKLGSAGALGSSNALVVNGGELDLNGYNLTATNLISSSSSAAGVVTNTSATTATLSVGGTDSSDYFYGSLTGNLALTVLPGISATHYLVLHNSEGSTYTGATTIEAGSSTTIRAMLINGAANALSASSAVTIGSYSQLQMWNFSATIASLSGIGSVAAWTATAGTATLTFGGNGTETTYSGQFIQGGNSILALAKSGTGTLTLASTSNNLTGGVTVSGGTLKLGSSGALGSSNALVVNGGELNLNGYNLTVTNLTSSSSSTTGVVTNSSATTATLSVGGTDSSDYFYGSLKGNLALTVLPGATAIYYLALNNSDNTTYSGATLIRGTSSTGARLRNAAVNALSPNSAVTVESGGLLQLFANNATVFSLSGNGTVDANSATTPTTPTTLTIAGDGTNTIFSGAITQSVQGKLALAKNGTGTLTLSPTSSNFTGGVTVSGGTLKLGSATAVASSNALTVNGGTLDLNGNSITVTALSGTGGVITDNGSSAGTSTLTVNETSSTTFAGVIQNGSTRSLALNKSASGVLTLTGTNTYTGGTTISQGELSVTGSLVSAVNATGGALSGTGTVGAVTISSGILSPGTSGVGTINTANLALGSGASFSVDLSESGSDCVNVVGTVSLASSPTLDIASSTRESHDGDVLVLIQNDGTDAVNGTFASRPEGSEVVVNGIAYFLTYHYDAESGQFDTGNDVALFSLAAPTVVVSDAGGTYCGSAFSASATVNGVSSLEGVSPTFTYYVGMDTSGECLGGSAPVDAGTYTVVAYFAGSSHYPAAQSDPVTFTITPATLTITVSAADKVYDGTNAATVTLTDERVSGDVLTVSYTPATFANKNAGEGKTVTVSGLSLGGTDAANYILASTTVIASASITPATLTVTGITAEDKVYDRSTAAVLNTAGAVLVGVLSGDTVAMKHRRGHGGPLPTRTQARTRW